MYLSLRFIKKKIKSKREKNIIIIHDCFKKINLHILIENYIMFKIYYVIYNLI